jgi:hypothetical protein
MLLIKLGTLKAANRPTKVKATIISAKLKAGVHKGGMKQGRNMGKPILVCGLIKTVGVARYYYYY